MTTCSTYLKVISFKVSVPNTKNSYTINVPLNFITTKNATAVTRDNAES